MKRYIPNKYVRVAIITATCLLFLYLAGVWLLKTYTKDIIKQAVSYQTEGKVNIDIATVNLKLSPARIDLLDTKLVFLDESGKNALYDIHFSYLGLQIHSLWEFILHRKIAIDFLVAENPRVEVNPAFKKLKQGNKSVPFEIGNIYLAMNKIARSMNIKRFGILNGNLTLNKLEPNLTTISIGGVNITGKELAMLPFDSDLIEQEFLAGRIRVSTGKQDVIFPEGNYRIRYSGLQLDTEEKTITLDSFRLNGKIKDTGYGSLDASFSRLKIFNMDFWSMYDSNLLKIDSVICQDPTLNLNIEVFNKKGQKEVTSDIPFEKTLAGLTGKIKIGYLGLLNSSINLTTKHADEYRTFTSNGNNFEAFEIDIDSSHAIPLDVGQLAFAIKNFRSPSKDGMYDIFFDSVLYKKESLSLLNFRLQPSIINKTKNKKYLTVANFELRDLSIAELITEKKLKARELYLKNLRSTNYYLPAANKSKRQPKPLKLILEELSDKIDLENIIVENGYLLNQSALYKNQRIIVGGLNSRISLNDMFDASTYELIGYSVGEVTFDSTVIQNGALKTSIYGGQVRGKEKKLLAASINFRDADSRTRLSAKNILLKNYHFDDEFKNIAVDSINYESASLVIDQGSLNPRKKTQGKSPNISFLLSHLSASRTTLDFLSGDTIKATGDFNHLEIKGAKLDAEKQISLQKLSINGNALRYSAPGMKARTGSFNINESQISEIKDINLEILKNADTVRGVIPSVKFTPEINKTLQLGHPVLRDVLLNKPVIFASVTKKGNTPGNKKEQSLELGSFRIIGGQIDFKQKNGNKSIWGRTSDIDISINKISKDINNQALSIGKTSISTRTVDLSLNDSIRLVMDNSMFNVELDHVTMGKGSDSTKFDMMLNKILAKQLNVGLLTKKGRLIELKKIDMGGELLQLDNLSKAHILKKIKENPSLFVSNINFSNVNEKSEMYAYGIDYKNGGKMVSIDSFKFKPAMDRDSFNRMQTYQKDYIELSTGKISARNFDIERIAIDSSFHIDYIEVLDPVFSDFKDKRLPFQTGIIKPLPVDLLKKIKVKFNVDSIRLYNGSITYEEFSDKTNSAATVHFGKVQARLRNIKNHNIVPTDSLYLGTTASFLDTAYVGVRFHESYSDTLSAFLLRVRVGRMSLPVLNPVIGPMASAKVNSGYLDTLELIAIGREYLAHGKMKMLYRDLKVEFLNKNDQTRKTLVTKLISYFANILVKRNNLKTTGSVFAERTRERSFINYWIKIVLSGGLTNAGIKSSSKQEKKYLKAVKKIQMPEIPDVIL